MTTFDACEADEVTTVLVEAMLAAIEPKQWIAARAALDVAIHRRVQAMPATRTFVCVECSGAVVEVTTDTTFNAVELDPPCATVYQADSSLGYETVAFACRACGLPAPVDSLIDVEWV